jgi:hypothetical protein
MPELYPQELPQPELPEQPEQEPGAPAGPPDYAAKRQKFLTKFAALDPEAAIDETTLADIMADEQKRDELAKYVGTLNPAFVLNGQQLGEGLGYSVKKKGGGAASGAGSPSTPSIEDGRFNGNPETMGRELGIRPQDAPDQSFLPTNISNSAIADALDPVRAAEGNARQYAPNFTGPVEGFPYQRSSDKGTAAEGTQYVDDPAQAAAPAAEAPAEDGFFSALGKGIGNIPGDLTRVAGNALDYLGDLSQRFLTPKSDVPEEYQDRVGVVTDDKPSDKIGQTLRETGDKIKFDISANARKSVLDEPTNGAAWGNLLGQGVNSVVQVGAASAVGGPLAGVAAGGALGISATKDAAREAGLSETEALYTATALAPVQGVLEELGVGFITKNPAVTGLLTKTIVGRALAEGGGKLSQAALTRAVSALLPEVAKRGLTAAGGEAVTEFLQAEAEGIAKLTADKLRGNPTAAPGQGRYGVTPFEALVKSPIEQGVGGALVGGPAGTLHSASTQAQPAKRQPIAGVKPVPATTKPADLRGRTVLISDEQGKAALRKVHNVVDTPQGRKFVLSDTQDRLSNHAAADVFINDSNARPSGPAGNRATQAVANLLPTPSGLQALTQATPVLSPTQPTTPTTTPAPTSAPRAPQAAPQARAAQPQPTITAPAEGPTLGELVPDEQPVALTYDGAQVQAFRNAEGDIELHQPNGQVTVLDKGDQFNQPAAAAKVAVPKVRVKVGDNVTLGQGEFATEQPIEEVWRDKSGQITALMVTGKNGSPIIDATTPEGKAALAELNAREQQPVAQPKTENPGLAARPQPATAQATPQPEATKPTPAYSTPAENRKAGRFTKDGQTFTRQQPLAERAVVGNETTVNFSADEQQPAKYALIEADDLQPSHTGGSQNLTHFLPEAQPKNRSAAFDQASRESIQGITANPDTKQLGEAPTAYAGAPVVNSRGEVIQGNGRAEGVRQHYRSGGTTYRAGILSAAERVGIDPAQGRQMKRPVLVRLADVSDTRAQQLGNYTAADTESGGQRRLDPKQATARLSDEGRAELAKLLTPQDEATLSETIRANQDGIFRFLQKHKLANSTQLQTLFKGGNGDITANGVEDISALHRNLVFAGGDPNLPELFQDLPAAAQGGIDRAAAALVGLPESVNITPELQNAIVGVNEYRRSGATFDAWSRQQSLFGGEGDSSPAGRYSPLELALIKLLTTEKRPTFIARAFSQYAAAVRGEKASLFDSVPALSRSEAVTKVFNTTDEKPSQSKPAASPASSTPANGRPATPPAPGMARPAAQPQRAAKPAAANPQPADAGQQLTPAAKRQAAIDKIKQRRAQQPTTPGVVEEYTQAYTLRDGEPESIRETGHQALAAAEKARRRAGGQLLPDDGNTNGGSGTLPSSANPAPQGYRGKAEVTQSSISAEMRQKGAVSFVGRIIRSIADIAEMAQVLRDPRWESFRYYLVKDLPDGTQQIVGERTLSARMPGTAPAFPAEGGRPGQTPAQWLASEMAAVGATKYYAQHNHPSGYVTPSQPDLAYTKFIAEQVPGFAGHLILNHGKYTVLTYEGGEVKTNANQQITTRQKAMSDMFRGYGKGWPTDPLNQPSKPGNLLGVAIGSAADVVGVAKAIENQEGWVALIGRGADGRVQAVGHLPIATLAVAIRGEGGTNRAEAAIRAFARETGSPHVVLAGLPKPKAPSKGGYLKSGDSKFLDLLPADIADLIAKGVLLDAVQVDGKALAAKVSKTRAQYQGQKWIGPTPAPRVWDNLADYGISDEDAADFRAVLESYIEEGTTSRKKLVARFREDVGSEAETGLSDEALRSLVQESQQAAGLVVKKAKPGKALKDRKHATRYDEATRRSFTRDEAQYAPVKQIENAETAQAYVRQVGLENAYAVALDKPDGFSPAAHIEVQEAVAREYRRLSDEARKAGNTDEAAEHWQKSKDVRAAKVSALTEAGQTLAQVQGFIADDPDAVLDLAIKETEKQKKPLLKKAEKAAAKVATIAIRERRAVMESTLKSEAVRKVRERVINPDAAPAPTRPVAEPTGYGAKNKYFTKASALAAREALRKLGLSTVVPPELVNFVGYHVEAIIRAGGQHNFAEVSRRVVRELGAKVKPLLPAAYESARKEYVAKGGDNAGFDTPEQIAQTIAPAAVQAGIKKLDTTLNRIAREQAAGLNMKGRTLAERFAAEAGIDPAQAQVYADAVEAEFQRQVVAKKTQLRNKLLAFSTRVLLGKNAATAVEKLLTTLNLATDPASANELLKKQLNLPDITPAQADQFVKLAEAVRKARPGNDRSDKVQDLMQALGKIEHVSKFDMLEANFYASVLSGPLTHAANITSNAKEAISENLISFLHTWAETGSLKAAASPTRGAYKAQQRAFTEAAKIISTGYTGSQSEKFGHNNVLENTTFKGAATPLNGLKYVGRALVGEDAYFNFTLRGMRSHELAMKIAYREVLKDASLAGEKRRSGELYARAWQNALGQLYGVANLRTAAESQADAEGLTGRARANRIGQLVNQEVQKQQDKWAAIAESEGLAGVAKQQRIGELQEQAQPAELVADAKKFAEIHTFNNGYEGTVGAMSALIAQLSEIPIGKAKPFKLIVPFSRILAAVTARRLEWAGMGFVRAIKGSTGSQSYQGGRFYREYTFEEREKAFLRSTIGTVSALALYSLAKAGIIAITGTGFGDRDKEEAEPSASIKWGKTGLFTSYEGDTMEFILAAIGNSLEYERKQEKAGKVVSPGKRLAVIAGLSAMYTLSATPAKGLEEFAGNIMSAAKNPDKGLNFAARFGANTAKAMVPYSAAIQQTFRGLGILTGANLKETASEEAWRSAYNSLVADIPHARDGMEDAIGIFGEPMKVSSHRMWGWQVERSAADQAAIDFMADNELLPTRSRITDDSLVGYDEKTGKLRPMNQKEFYTFQQVRGKEFARLMRELMKRPSDSPDLTPRMRELIRQQDAENDKALPDMALPEARKAISSAHRQAVAAGKEAVFGGDIVLLPTK